MRNLGVVLLLLVIGGCSLKSSEVNDDSTCVNEAQLFQRQYFLDPSMQFIIEDSLFCYSNDIEVVHSDSQSNADYFGVVAIFKKGTKCYKILENTFYFNELEIKSINEVERLSKYKRSKGKRKAAVIPSFSEFDETIGRDDYKILLGKNSIKVKAEYLYIDNGETIGDNSSEGMALSGDRENIFYWCIFW